MMSTCILQGGSGRLIKTWRKPNPTICTQTSAKEMYWPAHTTTVRSQRRQCQLKILQTLAMSNNSVDLIYWRRQW